MDGGGRSRVRGEGDPHRPAAGPAADRQAFADLQLLATVAATFSFLAIVFGNWLYIYYRAPVPDSPRSYFVKNMPEIHRIFFEFKEFSALFTLPLTVCAAFVLWRYGTDVLARPWLRYTVAVLLGLAFFYLVIAFGLGPP